MVIFMSAAVTIHCDSLHVTAQLDTSRLLSCIRALFEVSLAWQHTGCRTISMKRKGEKD